MADEGGSLRLTADVTSMLIKCNTGLGGVQLIHREITQSVLVLSLAPGPFQDAIFFIIQPPPPAGKAVLPSSSLATAERDTDCRAA